MRIVFRVGLVAGQGVDSQCFVASFWILPVATIVVAKVYGWDPVT